jgi:hypothetical protein
MSEAVQIILGVLFLILVFIATRYGIFLRVKSACKFVVRDLERKNALDAASAVELPYAKTSYFHIGLRDFRPKAVQSLLAGGVIGKTANEKYYLKVTPEEVEIR